ncbi:MAG: nitroreductase family protein [Phycisphaeraceae bacterium]|nr:nitroreductase family protein [Phycisphaeraceae bacterium]
MNKPANTQHPVHELIRNRWSPRAFSDRPVPPELLQQVFEAARWAASSFNEQPWSYIVATRDNPQEHGLALSCLVEANQQWAKHAPVLILTVVRKTFAKNGKPNRCREHDLGLADGNICIQATALGLMVHQMAGVNLEQVRHTYQIPDTHEPFSAIAIGYPGGEAEIARLPEQFQEGETAPRTRKPLDQFVFSRRFGSKANLVG